MPRCLKADYYELSVKYLIHAFVSKLTETDLSCNVGINNFFLGKSEQYFISQSHHKPFLRKKLLLESLLNQGLKLNSL